MYLFLSFIVPSIQTKAVTKNRFHGLLIFKQMDKPILLTLDTISKLREK